MWSLSSLTAAALTSSLLFQPAASLGGIFRDLDSLETDGPNAPTIVGSALHALPPWDADESWTKRSEDDLTMLEPTESEAYFWGGPRRGNRAPFFNITMFADENERIISMEKFIPMLDHVECGERMVLAFKNKAGFEHAIRAWGWVNEEETRSFIMIANHPACGKEERQPYYILDVDYDEGKNIAYLYGEEKSLQEVAHTFDAEFGHVDLPDIEGSELSRRWPWNDDAEGSFDIDVEDEYVGPIVDMDSDSAGNYLLECKSCGFTGGISFHGRLGFTFGIPHSVSLGFDARDLGAYAHIKLDVHGLLPVYAYYIDSIIPKEVAMKSPLGVILAFVKPQFGVTLGGATGNFSISTGASAKFPSDATSEISLDSPDDILDPDLDFGNWDIDADYDGLDFKGHVESFSGSFFLQLYAGIPDIDGISLFAGLTGKAINIDVIWQDSCAEETSGNSKDSISIAFSNVFGAVLGTGPAYGVSLSMPNPFEKRSEVPDATEQPSEESHTPEKRWPVGLPGGALTWTFAKKIWAQPTFCIDNIFTKREKPKLATGGVPHVRRGSTYS
ncbi:hypothetical protein FQN54_006878 [Arachnomyces sp. PD_36]|nr:hypothetical protein FQN54_006878 [Arachnomyces sp. PD_36]